MSPTIEDYDDQETQQRNSVDQEPQASNDGHQGMSSREIEMAQAITKWAFGASICQKAESLWRPVRFVSRVFKATEIRYHDAEKEVLALLKVLEVGRNFLVGSGPIQVYIKYSIMKWLFTSKLSTGRSVKWAAMLSPWEREVIRSEKFSDGLNGLLATSITPLDHFEEALQEIEPMKCNLKMNEVSPLPTLNETDSGFVGTFDGSVRKKNPTGSYGAVLWKLPGWEIVEAAYGYRQNLTVNDT